MRPVTSLRISGQLSWRALFLPSLRYEAGKDARQLHFAGSPCSTPPGRLIVSTPRLIQRAIRFCSGGCSLTPIVITISITQSRLPKELVFDLDSAQDSYGLDSWLCCTHSATATLS